MTESRVVTAATVEPVTLAEARLDLRLGSDETAENALITDLITTARELAEHGCERALAPCTRELAMDAFPACNASFLLDMPPITAITSITYVDADGVTQTLNSAKYLLSQFGTGRKVSLTYGNEWPETRLQPEAVKVLYTAGYAADDLPRAAKTAMLLIIGHLFENRQEVVVGGGAQAIQIPVGAQSLLDTIKVWSA